MIKYLLLLFFFTPLYATFPKEVSGRILYQIYHDDITSAMEGYLIYSKEHEAHDYDLLSEMGVLLLRKGAESDDSESEMMALYGSGFALRTSVFDILKKGLESNDLEKQLISLSFLTRIEDDSADSLLSHALVSPFLLTRLEAALALAVRQDKKVLGHIETLLIKTPPQLRPLFAQILVHLESKGAKHLLRQFLSDKDPLVRCATMLEIAKNGRDDFTSLIREHLSLPSPLDQECAALSAALLKDSHSLPLLRKLEKSKEKNVRLASLGALVALGDYEKIYEIERLALEKNPFAITLLAKFEQEDEQIAASLKTLLSDPDPAIRLNATLVLLRRKETACLPALKTFLLTSDMGFHSVSSPGKALNAFTIIYSAAHQEKYYPSLLAETQNLKEKALLLALELPEDDFLSLVAFLFDHNESSLFFYLVELLVNHQSEKTIALLKKYQQKAGVPLLRGACNLALFRLNAEGPEPLCAWIKNESQNNQILFKKEEKETKKLSEHTLTPLESSQLLIGSFEALTNTHHARGLEVLLEAIAHGHPKNRFLLAGILLRTAE